MTTENFEDELSRLEAKIESLTGICEQLKAENDSLRERQIEWSRERAQLVEQAAIAKNRVEAMISRLKSMGHES